MFELKFEVIIVLNSNLCIGIELGIEFFDTKMLDNDTDTKSRYLDRVPIPIPKISKFSIPIPIPIPLVSRVSIPIPRYLL